MSLLSDRAREIEERFASNEAALAASSDAGDIDLMRKLSKDRSMLEPVLEAARRYQSALKEMEGVQEILGQANLDPELRAMALEDRKGLEARFPDIERDFKRKLLPPDPLDERNVLVEIRAGTGGEEAALFSAVLYKMYMKYAERCGFRTEMISSNRTEIGGYKEIVFSVEGERVYSRLKYEGGVHRVQRVPKTEASGRIHTSASTVAVLPEADEVDVQIDMNDLRVDVYRSQGPGGQSVNTTDSAVRITHVPTGLVVTCQDEKSQLKNKNKAFRVLRARLKEMQEEKVRSEQASARRSMVGSGDRSERIRTYNFPQGRVTDHRIELTLYAIDEIIEGDLDRLIEPLSLADEQIRLEEQLEKGPVR
ncbi:MAG: peptide chain release factor 1 [Candidatus Hydrogenedentota bacterium]